MDTRAVQNAGFGRQTGLRSRSTPSTSTNSSGFGYNDDRPIRSSGIYSLDVGFESNQSATPKKSVHVAESKNETGEYSSDFEEDR